MPRSALIVSLALHAGFIGLIASWSLAMRGGSDNPEVAVSFSAGNEAESLLVQATPAAPPEPAPFQTQPEFNFPALAVAASPPLISASASSAFQLPADIAIAHAVPAVQPALSPTTNHHQKSRPVVRSGRNTNSRSSSPGGAANGELSGAGRGSGGGGYVPPQFRLRYKPPYPVAARAQRLEGTVLLLVSVDSAGRVTQADIQRTCGHALLDRAALDAVRSWRFEPARQDGVATAAQVEVPVRFHFG